MLEFKEQREARTNNRKAIISMLVAIVICAITLVSIVGNQVRKISNNQSKSQIAEMNAYNEITDEDADIDNCEYVKFSSFFTKDLNGDGYAEKYDGACNALDKKQTLWFDINVLTDGTLKNGKITINGKNFDLQTLLVKDEFLKSDYIGKDIKTIEFNDINYGSQKLFNGIILADIGSNINNYSREDNTVTLTGTWVSTEGTQTVEINKTITLKVDWYGKTVTTAYPYISTSHDISTAIGDEYVTISFNAGYRETAEELIIQKQITEIDIPDFNGYSPESVIVTSQNCTYEYEEETQKLTITRQATVDGNGNITQSISRDNVYSIQVKYPIESYETLGQTTISITFPTTGYYYGYNNSNEDFEYDNPYISQASRTWTHTWREPAGSAASFSVEIGKYVYNPDTKTYRYVISKEKPLKIYNDIGLEEDETDEYTVIWRAYTGNTFANQNGIYMEENDVDKFLDSENQYTNMTSYIKTKAIYFSSLSNVLEEDGWLKIYDSETDELLATFTQENWGDYNSSNPYTFERPVQGIKVETSKAKNSSYLYVYQIKEIDDEELTSSYTQEEFEKLNYIYTYLKGSLYADTVKTQINTTSARAYYEAPVSLLSFEVTPEAISNQETKNINLKITTESSRYNEAKWKDGIFVIELPEEILEANISSVRSNNNNVEITSYETYEVDGKIYMKIYTSNETEATYTLTINADVTADPRKSTTTKSVKLYAINNNCHNYRDTSRTADILDINSNGNTVENVLYKTDSITIIAPASLLTSQTLSEYDDQNSEVVSPQIAIIDKSSNTRDAKVNITITNNYSGTLSEPIIIGKIPFEGNTYQINGKSLGSTYSVTMKNTGITLPQAVASVAKVYYSTNESVTNSLTDESNNWKSADEVTDWSQIKTYAIDLSEYVLQKDESMTFNYEIVIPANINYNGVSYSTHAVYFCLDTEDGKLKTKTEVNRLGIMIAKKYDLSLTKYKKGTNTKAQGATYKITDGTNIRTGITDTNGVATIEGLFVDKEYTMTEIASPDSYILNDDKVTFKITVDNNGDPQITTTGTLREAATIQNVDGKYTLNLEVEDEAKYDVKIVKTGESNSKLKGVKYRLTGGTYGDTGRIYTTNADGEISIINLIPGTTYTLSETKATGYYVKQTPMTFTVTRNASGELIISSTDSEISSSNIVETEGVDKAIVNLNLADEKIPTYKLKIVKKNDEGEYLANTQFKLTSIDTGDVTYVTTDTNGSAQIDGLYQYVDGKYVTGEYILQEILATEGYITDQTEVKFKAEVVSDVLNITVIEGEDVVVDSWSTDEDISLEFENKPVFKLTKKGDQDSLLPNAKFTITDVNGYPALDIDGNPIGTEEGKAPVYLKFESATNYPWTKNSDGVWQSGNYNIASTTSTLTSKEFTIEETSKLTFDWSVSSQGTSYDYLYYTIKNVSTGATIGGTSTKIGGTSYGTEYKKLTFNTVNINLQPGTYTIAFSYYKNASTNTGLDSGFVKNVRIDGDGYYYLETDENGELSADLTNGMYKVIEIEVPDGYELLENEEDRTWYVGIGESRPEETEFNIKWAKTINGLGRSDVYDIETTTDGGYIVAGSFNGNCDLDNDGTTDITSTNSFDGLIVKYDGAGNVQWDYELSSYETTEFLGISKTSDGYVAVGHEGTDGIIVKIDSSGNQVWKNTVSGTGTEELKSVKVLASGDIIITGRTNSSTLTLGTDTLTNSGLFDGFVVCYARRWNI